MDLPRKLSASYKEDFAYPTVKDRLPVILTKAVDTLCRMKTQVFEELGETGTGELKSIIGRLSKLKNELQTGKPLAPITDDSSDVHAWNKYLEGERKQLGGKEPSWFVSPWLYTECYFYRRIREAVLLSSMLRHLDPFSAQKENALISSLDACVGLSECLYVAEESTTECKDSFWEFVQVALWGNKCDLSISAGAENAQTENLMTQLKHLEEQVICNDFESLWQYVSNKMSPTSNTERIIDIILDNAGFELFTDLCFADFLLESKMATVVRFHGKAMPWFVSDVTRTDLDWTLSKLENSEHSHLSAYAKKWIENLETKKWEYHAHDFWTRPEDFACMEQCCPDLYSQLSQSMLLIFKGDLNFRKLVGDLKWPVDTPFSTALREFRPAPVLALRTLKCDLVVGFNEEKAKKIGEKESDWMVTGRWGVIHFNEA